MNLTCAICGKEVRKLFLHLKKHGMTLEQYREKYPDVPTNMSEAQELKRKMENPDYDPNADLVKCEICGAELRIVNTLHLKKHDMTLEEYVQKFPNAELGYARKKKKKHRKSHSLENSQKITCAVCGGSFQVMTATHLAKHGMTMDEYQETYPDANIGNSRTSGIDYKRMVSYENPQEKKNAEYVSLNIVEDGNLRIVRPTKSAYIKFQTLKKRRGWTIAETLHNLVDFFEKHENEEGAEIAIEHLRHASTGLPKDFIPQHRDKLQNILSMLEEKAFEEKDPSKLASLTDKIIKINLALPQLEKSDESLVDLKIKEIMEKRKMIFANSLPELE